MMRSMRGAAPHPPRKSPRAWRSMRVTRARRDHEEHGVFKRNEAAVESSLVIAAGDDAQGVGARWDMLSENTLNPVPQTQLARIAHERKSHVAQPCDSSVFADLRCCLSEMA